MGFALPLGARSPLCVLDITPSKHEHADRACTFAFKGITPSLNSSYLAIGVTGGWDGKKDKRHAARRS